MAGKGVETIADEELGTKIALAVTRLIVQRGRELARVNRLPTQGKRPETVPDNGHETHSSSSSYRARAGFPAALRLLCCSRHDPNRPRPHPRRPPAVDEPPVRSLRQKDPQARQALGPGQGHPGL